MDSATTCLDLRHLRCPMPIVEIAKAAKALPPGSTLEVQATDPAFPLDIESWCNKTGNRLEALDGQGDVFIARIVKCGP